MTYEIMGVDCDCGAEPDDELDDELLVEALRFMASVLITDRAKVGEPNRDRDVQLARAAVFALRQTRARMALDG